MDFIDYRNLKNFVRIGPRTHGASYTHQRDCRQLSPSQPSMFQTTRCSSEHYQFQMTPSTIVLPLQSFGIGGATCYEARVGGDSRIVLGFGLLQLLKNPQAFPTLPCLLVSAPFPLSGAS